ncbi:hypothetical protein [Ornithinicoccus halotolerans]|uniref:hypothetical protein n=1 Tax=Ornithinicoccus halotolerans TaxID=1748220 RepID=UPI0012950612|nr:hypothetical protein [Ornithinicoccus halotolerans]
MITLPDGPPTRGLLRGWALAMALPAATATVVARPHLPGRARAAATALTVSTLGLGIACPTTMLPAYRGWAWLARRGSQALTSYAGWVTHVTAVPVTGAAQVRPPEPGRSTWQRPQQQPAALPRWLSTCLAVLGWLQDDREPVTDALPHDTYTLY